MILSRIISILYCTALLISTSACANIASSVAESTLVFVVAKHDETVEKKEKKYTATDKCIFIGDLQALALGDAIAYGQPITVKYDRLLSRTGEDIDPVQPMQLAYAFYVIADEIHDNRGKARMKWLENQMKPEDTAAVRSIIDDKYLASHLERCFSVPDQYRIIKTTRDLIKEQQAELEEQNGK